MEKLQKRIDEGLPTPFWDNRPRVAQYATTYLEAFTDLSSDRQVGGMGGVMGIPFQSIDRWAERHGFDDPDSFETLKRIIKAVDSFWVNKVNSKSANRPKKK